MPRPRPAAARRTVRFVRRSAFLAACAVGLLASDAAAQFGPPRGDRGPGGRGGRPDPGRMFEQFDADGDGTLSADEIAKSPLSRFADRLGLDASKPITRAAFDAASDRRRDEREANGGRRGRGERGDRGGEEPRQDDRRDRPEDRGDDRRADDRAPSPDARRGTAAPTSRSSFRGGDRRDDRRGAYRFTLPLPDGFGELDPNGDGQIGLYEWRRWNRKLTGEFLTLDKNRDGFLTPRELDGVDPKQYAQGEAAAAPLRPVAAASSVRGSNAPPASDGGPAPEISDRDRKAGERYFTLLDRDRNGRISLEEWEKSSRLKPKFEAVGADLASELNQDAFVTAYGKTLAQ